MVALAFVLALRSDALAQNAEVRISAAKSLLGSFGVKGSLRLQQLNLPNDNPLGEGDVVLSDSNHSPYTVRFKGPNGTIYSICRGSWPNVIRGFNMVPILNDQIDRKVEGWARRLCGNDQIKLDSLIADGKGYGEAEFSILKNGYPIIGSKPCDCSIEFTTPDIRFVSIIVRNEPLPVDPRLPVLSQADAVKVFQRIYTFDVATKAMEEHGWKLTYKLMGAPTIGYYLPDGDRVARLVWKVSYMGYRDVGYAIQGGSNAMLIDAIDGKQIVTKVVL